MIDHCSAMLSLDFANRTVSTVGIRLLRDRRDPAHKYYEHYETGTTKLVDGPTVAHTAARHSRSTAYLVSLNLAALPGRLSGRLHLVASSCYCQDTNSSGVDETLLFFGTLNFASETQMIWVLGIREVEKVWKKLEKN